MKPQQYVSQNSDRSVWAVQTLSDNLKVSDTLDVKLQPKEIGGGGGVERLSIRKTEQQYNVDKDVVGFVSGED